MWTICFLVMGITCNTCVKVSVSTDGFLNELSYLTKKVITDYDVMCDRDGGGKSVSCDSDVDACAEYAATVVSTIIDGTYIWKYT